MTYDELAAKLSETLKALSVKKGAMDSANETAAKATNEYKETLTLAQEYRDQLNASLANILPSTTKSKIG